MNVPQTKRPLDVYFVLIVVATIFMLLACIFMAMEAWSYGSPWANPSASAATLIRSVV